jgi:hypothetical protein
MNDLNHYPYAYCAVCATVQVVVCAENDECSACLRCQVCRYLVATLFMRPRREDWTALPTEGGVARRP